MRFNNDPQDAPDEVDFTATVTMILTVRGKRQPSMDDGEVADELAIRSVWMPPVFDSDALGSADVTIDEIDVEVDCD